MHKPSMVLPVLALALCCVAVARPAEPAAAPSGPRLYLDCAACHGKDGSGVADGSVPAIGGQPARAIAAALEDFRSGRRKDLRMRHFSDPQHLATEAEVAAVAAHVASLRRVTPAGTGDGRRLVEGAALFRRHCASCHGDDAAAGEVPLRRALAGQHAGYIERKMVEGGVTTAQARVHAVLGRDIGRPGIAAIADHLSRLPPP